MLFFARAKNLIWKKLVHWLTYEPPNFQTPLTSFERMRYELRPGDIVLVEGRSKVADIIKSITSSMWTHSFLYIGRLHDIDDTSLRDRIQKFRHCSPDEQLIIEAFLGKGIIVSSLADYEGEHMRICRPRGITRHDSQEVIRYCILELGLDYDVHQVMDLARFMFPYWFIPKRWRSSLFEHNTGKPTQTVCSTLIAEAFAHVRFPIIPVLHNDEHGRLKLIRRNSKLVTPRDFDHSPYFDVIKYPILDFDELGIYRKLPWDQTGVHCTDIGDCFYSDPAELEQLNQVSSASTVHLDIYPSEVNHTGTGDVDEAGDESDNESSNNKPDDKNTAVK